MAATRSHLSAEDNYSCLSERFDNFFTRMVMWIASSNGDYCKSWSDKHLIKPVQSSFSFLQTPILIPDDPAVMGHGNNIAVKRPAAHGKNCLPLQIVCITRKKNGVLSNLENEDPTRYI